MIVRLSVLRKTILNPEYYVFMHEWCVVFICRLQIEQVKSDCTVSDDDPLVLALHSLRFLSASQILFASY